MNYLRFNYTTIAQSNSVVVLCAGPSMTSCAEKTKKYIEDNKSVVISANYDYERFGINSNYIYITDTMKLIELIGTLRCPLVVPATPKTDRVFKKKAKEAMKRYSNSIDILIQKEIPTGVKVYQVGHSSMESTYKIHKYELINMSSTREFSHCRLGSAGQGAITLSVVFRPKKVLIVGLDGPTQENTQVKYMFDGTQVKYGDADKFHDANRYISKIMLPSLFSKNIQIETFEDVKFYGIAREKYGIKILDK